MSRKEYVLIWPVWNKTVLVHFKLSGPAYAQGLNGAGGKVEEGEAPADAAFREYREEVGGVSSCGELLPIGPVAEGEDFIVHGFALDVEPMGRGQFVDGLPATWLSPFADVETARWAGGARESAKQAVRVVLGVA